MVEGKITGIIVTTAVLDSQDHHSIQFVKLVINAVFFMTSFTWMINHTQLQRLLGSVNLDL